MVYCLKRVVLWPLFQRFLAGRNHIFVDFLSLYTWLKDGYLLQTSELSSNFSITAFYSAKKYFKVYIPNSEFKIGKLNEVSKFEIQTDDDYNDDDGCSPVMSALFRVKHLISANLWHALSRLEVPRTELLLVLCKFITSELMNSSVSPVSRWEICSIPESTTYFHAPSHEFSEYISSRGTSEQLAEDGEEGGEEVY